MTSSPHCRVTYSSELPDEFGLTIVPAEHPAWKGSLVLDPASKRVTQFLSGAGGTYELRGMVLQILWDDQQADTFLFDGSRYRHASLIDPADETKESAWSFWRG